MNIVIVFGNPQKDNLHKNLADVVLSKLKKNGHSVSCHDLYHEGFNKLDSKKEVTDTAMIKVINQHRQEVSGADGFIIIHPNQQGQPPEVFEAWVDMVMCDGVAYRLQEDDNEAVEPSGLLKAESAVVFVTASTPVVRELAICQSSLKLVWEQSVFSLSGVKNFELKVFAIKGRRGHADIDEWLDDINQVLNKHFPSGKEVSVKKSAAPVKHIKESVKKITPPAKKNVVVKPKKEWEIVFDIVNAMLDAKIAVNKFYNVCLKAWKNDKAFWEPLIQETDRHIKNLRKMTEIIKKRPKEFRRGDPVSLEGSKIFVTDVEKNVERVKKEELPIKDALVVARDISVPLIIKRYNEIIVSRDQEYNGLISEIISESILHKNKISKRITDMTSGASKVQSQPEVVLARQLEPDDSSSHAQIVRQHQQAREYMESLRELVDILESQNAWKYLSKLEKFLKRDVAEHFKYEDEVVFDLLFAVNPDEKTSETINKLKYDHQQIYDKIGDFEQMIFGEIFPIPQKKIDVIRGFIDGFIDDFIKHLNNEDELILPLLQDR